MIKVFPKLRKLETFPDNEYYFKDNLNAFFTNDKVNVFNAFTNRKVDFNLEDCENADIIYTRVDYIVSQAYRLEIKDKIYIYYGDDAGAYYASVTLNQILNEEKVEYCEIYDEPRIQIRGFMLDISRDKVATVETIKKIIDLMALLKMNHFELYVEGFSFEYKSFPEYLEKDGYITVSEYQELEKYANERFIDMVPNQNGFGHMADWLEKEEFKDLRICPDGSYIWGRHRRPSTLNPLKEESLELIKKMYADMLPYSNSKYFNMNFDEPFELGLELTEEVCQKEGKGNVYLDYTLKVYDLVKSYGKTPIIWGDVLLQHKDVLTKLPKDMIFVDWGYDADYRFKKNAKSLIKRDIQFMCAPGTTSWCTWSTRTYDWIEQINNAVNAVKEGKGFGVLLTDWGDFGHLQFWSMSYAPLVYCGLYSWTCREGTLNRTKDFLNKFVFKDKSGLMASWFLDFGNYYYLDTGYHHNQTATFRIFMWATAAVDDVKSGNKDEIIDYYKSKVLPNDLPFAKYKTMSDFFDYKIKALEYVDMQCDEKDLIIAECIQSIKVLKMIQGLAISTNETIEKEERIRILKDILQNKDSIIGEQRRLWLVRNKSGYLDKSIGYFERFYEFVEIMIEYLDKKGEKV